MYSWLFSKASLNIAIVHGFPPPTPCEYVRYWNDTWNTTSPSRRNESKNMPHPLAVFRRSVRLMDTYASLEAKRTPDVWEGIPRLKWVTLEQNTLSQRGLCLNSLLLLEEEGGERVPPAPWLGKDTDNPVLQWIHYKRPHTHRYFFSQQSKYKVKHNWAIVLVMHNVYASKNRRKIEKSTLTKVSPVSLPGAPKKMPRETQENNT